MHRYALAVSLAAATALVTLIAAPASACGGLFCSVPPPDVPTPPLPVDQTAERIVFEVGDDTVTAHVQISYFGPASEFAWIVPVPDTPEVEESDPAMFPAIDAATALQVVLPPPELCPVPSGGGGGGGGCVGCGMADASGALEDGESPTQGAEPESPVTVYASDVTENYEYSVIGAEFADDLIDWLNDNDYNVSENMVPVMQPYVDEGMRYLAVKLREGREASDIVPLAMTYPGDEPMIPIRLTAVAAQPLMGIQVWIFGDAPYLPENYAWEEPDDSEIVSDVNGNTSYFEWVGRAVAEAEGTLFVAEFVGQNQTGRFPQHPVVSRWYTRLSPELMRVDPVFARAASAPVIDNTLDLSWQPTPFTCGGPAFERLPSVCGFNFCGVDAVCTEVDGRAGCVCLDGEVAQTIMGPDGSRRVTCVPADNPFGITPQAAGAGTEFDPCGDIECGAGVCVLRNGFPTCDCEPGAAACVEPDGSVLCVAMPENSPTFGPGAGSESAGVMTASAQPTRRVSNIAFGNMVPPLLVLALFAALGGRRRRTP